MWHFYGKVILYQRWQSKMCFQKWCQGKIYTNNSIIFTPRNHKTRKEKCIFAVPYDTISDSTVWSKWHGRKIIDKHRRTNMELYLYLLLVLLYFIMLDLRLLLFRNQFTFIYVKMNILFSEPFAERYFADGLINYKRRCNYFRSFVDTIFCRYLFRWNI